MDKKLYFYGITEEVLDGLEELSRAEYIHLGQQNNSLSVQVKKCKKGFYLNANEKEISIFYNKKPDFFRAISYLTANLKNDKIVFEVEQVPVIQELGTMLDCSRNGVLTVESVKRFIRYMSLMGLNTLQLYTEDTYELPDYPYFGYLRGRYTADEITEMDSYAQMFGVELIPCVQTLAHLTLPLRWSCFDEIRDMPDTLMCDEEKTYEFIEAVILQLKKCFISRTVNIGMDEAGMLGLGQYLKKHGYTDHIEVMLRHFNRVVKICSKHGFSPMMWSDMFFRLATGCYGEADIDDETAERISKQVPPEIKLIYWQYDLTDPKKYSHMMSEHKKLTPKLAFAGGAWTWGSFAPHLQQSIKVAEAALLACLENKLETVFVTVWGDNGSECSFFSILPILQLYGEFAYTGSIPLKKQLSGRLLDCTGLSLEAFEALELPNRTTETQNDIVSPCKYLFYQDVPVGMFDCHVEESFCFVYQGHSKKLKEVAQHAGQWQYLFILSASLCDVLSVKCMLGNHIRTAYRNQDRQALEEISRRDIPILLKYFEKFMNDYRIRWFFENKPQGFEVFDLRTGGIIARIENLKKRLECYLNGSLRDMPELLEEPLVFDISQNLDIDINADCTQWHRISTPSIISIVI